MAVKQVPVKFASSDGQEFVTQEEAEKHDQLITARKEYESARSRFGIILAKTQQTADGEYLDFSIYRRYYFVSDPWHGLPELREVSFSPWGWEFDDSDGFVIRQEEGHDYSNRQVVNYRISELYADEKNAQMALLKAQEEKLADYAKRVKELRKKVTDK